MWWYSSCDAVIIERMHEDGIVADGVVYSSLVSAFSAENVWKQASGEVREELPGKPYTPCWFVYDVDVNTLWVFKLTNATSLFIHFLQTGPTAHL